MTDPITALKSHIEQAQREMDANVDRQKARREKYQKDSAQDATEYVELKGFVERSQEFFRAYEADQGKEEKAGEGSEPPAETPTAPA